MECYFFKVKITPAINDAHPQSIAGAYAVVYVFSDTPGNAKTVAINHLEQYQWSVQNFESVSQMTPALLSQLRENQVAGYREAKTSGISFEVLDAWPNFLDSVFSQPSPLSLHLSCKHWLMPSCPQRNNECMMKTEKFPQGLEQYISTSDIEIINRLCLPCPKYEENN